MAVLLRRKNVNLKYLTTLHHQSPTKITCNFVTISEPNNRYK